MSGAPSAAAAWAGGHRPRLRGSTTMSDVFYVWGGRFDTTAKAFQVPPSAGDIVDGFETHGPFATEAEADRAWLGLTRRNVDICAHRMLVQPVSADASAAFLARLLAAFAQGSHARMAARFWQAVVSSRALPAAAPGTPPAGGIVADQGDAASPNAQGMRFFA